MLLQTVWYGQRNNQKNKQVFRKESLQIYMGTWCLIRWHFSKWRKFGLFITVLGKLSRQETI